MAQKVSGVAQMLRSGGAFGRLAVPVKVLGVSPDAGFAAARSLVAGRGKRRGRKVLGADLVIDAIAKYDLGEFFVGQVAGSVIVIVHEQVLNLTAGQVNAKPFHGPGEFIHIHGATVIRVEVLERTLQRLGVLPRRCSSCGSCRARPPQ